jgi:hypothetical protein
VDDVGEHRELQQQFGERLLELVFDRVGIGRAQFLDVARAPGERSLDRRVLEPLEAVDDVIGGELLAAAERDVVTQLERIGPAVLADRPRLGEIGDRRAAVPVERDQRILEHVDDVGGRSPAGALRIVMRRVDAFMMVSVWAAAVPAIPNANATLRTDLIMSAASDRGRRGMRRPKVGGQHDHEDGTARDRRDMRRHEQEVAALRRHHAEFGGRRLRAHAEEAERRADQDDLAEAQGEKHEDRRNAVERQVAPDQSRVDTPTARPASMNSWPITPIAAPRATRATSGTVATTSAITTGRQPGAEDRGHREPDQDRGKASITSTSRMIQPSRRR